MSKLLDIITATDPALRDRSIESFCLDASLKTLFKECEALDQFWRLCPNLYERVRALFFLYAIHRYYLPQKLSQNSVGHIPFSGYTVLLKRRFEEAIDIFLDAQKQQGQSFAISSALAEAYHQLAFQTLANQVRTSVRSVRGNQWMFRIGHPLDHPLRVLPELCEVDPQSKLFPIVKELTPVRMDLSHSGWSDIFFLGMDYPQGAQVLNVSIDLSIRGKDHGEKPKPPIEVYFRIIDEPVLKLTSVDLNATAEITSIYEVFDFAKDYLGLLKAAVIASGIVLPGMESADQPLSELFSRIIKPGHGIELVSKVNGIPKGSRLAVSTNLLASLIAVCMRATGQTESLTGPLTEADRRIVAARAILGEWLGGSGGGWQDSGGIWPGMKLICGVAAQEGDPEFGISKGRLLPDHTILDTEAVSEEHRKLLQDSLVLVHGGMAQDVGPILEMVTEKYLLRLEKEWHARHRATDLFSAIVSNLKKGDISGLGSATEENFFGPIQAIIPWASNTFTESIIQQVKDEFGDDFWGFWMLGGMSGGGMGFIVEPTRKKELQDRLSDIMGATKEKMQKAVPFAMDPVVYDFAINEKGSVAQLLRSENALLPLEYYTQVMPKLLRQEQHQLSQSRKHELSQLGYASRKNPELSGMVHALFDRILPSMEEATKVGDSLEELLKEYGFDPVQHENIRADLRSGKIGLAQNQLAANVEIRDVVKEQVVDATEGLGQSYHDSGMAALRAGEVAVVTLAAGSGSRWTKGAGVVKGINPFCKLSEEHRTFIEVQLAKSRHTAEIVKKSVPHIITTSFMTHTPIERFLQDCNSYDYQGPLYLSLGQSIGLRMVPMIRDLRFAWEELSQQLLDEQAQKVLESERAAFITWAKQCGEGADYRDNLPLQCLHPVGHWYEIPNLFRNGTLKQALAERPQLKHLLVHNIDTLGANLDPALLGYHIQKQKAFTIEVINRGVEDRGGGLAQIDGQVRLVEGLTLPREEIEFDLSYYNSNTFWIDIDMLLDLFSLTRSDLDNDEKVLTEVRKVAARMPTYVTLKEVKKRWGKGQEDIYPIAQFEKLWGDMTALPEATCQYMVVPRFRGQQLKEPAQLDAWLRDGSAAFVENLCTWE